MIAASEGSVDIVPTRPDSEWLAFHLFRSSRQRLTPERGRPHRMPETSSRTIACPSRVVPETSAQTGSQRQEARSIAQTKPRAELMPARETATRGGPSPIEHPLCYSTELQHPFFNWGRLPDLAAQPYARSAAVVHRGMLENEVRFSSPLALEKAARFLYAERAGGGCPHLKFTSAPR